MATISVNDFATDEHGCGVEKRVGPKEQDVEFAFRFCMRLREKLGNICHEMAIKFAVSFYKYPFGGLAMKLKIKMTEPDNGEDFETRFEMNCLQSWDFKPEALEQILNKGIEKCLADIHKTIQHRIDIPKKKQNEMAKLLSDTKINKQGKEK